MFRRIHRQAAAWTLGLAMTGWSAYADDLDVVQDHKAGAHHVTPHRVIVEPAETEPEEFAEDEGAIAPKIELIQERFPNGKIHIERYVTQDAAGNYVNHGSYVEYNQQGKKVSDGEFKLGRHHGTFIRWYEPTTCALFDDPTQKLFRPPFVAEVQLNDGQLHGDWTIYDSRQVKVAVWHFEHGKRDGKSIWFFPNGQPAREVSYRNGLLDGKSQAWTIKGQVAADDTFIAGRRLAQTTHWHSKGKKRVEGNTLFAKQPIETRYDWWNGSIVITNAPDPGIDEKTGLWTWWYANGQRQCEGHFSDNAPDGKWTIWHANGQKEMEGSYVAGEQTGRWFNWSENGLLVNAEPRAATTSEPEVDSSASADTKVAPPPRQFGARDGSGMDRPFRSLALPQIALVDLR